MADSTRPEAAIPASSMIRPRQLGQGRWAHAQENLTIPTIVTVCRSGSLRVPRLSTRKRTMVHGRQIAPPSLGKRSISFRRFMPLLSPSPFRQGAKTTENEKSHPKAACLIALLGVPTAIRSKPLLARGSGCGADSLGDYRVAADSAQAIHDRNSSQPEACEIRQFGMLRGIVVQLRFGQHCEHAPVRSKAFDAGRHPVELKSAQIPPG